jgi:hypothetical protein
MTEYSIDQLVETLIPMLDNLRLNAEKPDLVNRDADWIQNILLAYQAINRLEGSTNG